MFIVFDLDDTLAITDHRQHLLEIDYDTETDERARWNAFFDACDEDVPNTQIINLLNSLAIPMDRHRIEIWTGRSDRVREKTEAWLIKHVQGLHYITLRMRKEGDFRPDTEIKAEFIERYGKPDLTFDDRNKVVAWWREQGITCCQVRESNF